MTSKQFFIAGFVVTGSVLLFQAYKHGWIASIIIGMVAEL